jgi:methanogenic corrinoid protein MtbC1
MTNTPTSAETLRARLEELAVTITPVGAHPRCLEDARFHLRYLAAALEANSAALFLDYVAWAKVLLVQRRVPERDLHDQLVTLAGALREIPDARSYVETAIDELPAMPDDVPSSLDPRAPHWALASEYLNAMLRADRTAATQTVLAAVDGGVPLRDIYRHVLEPVQHEIGRLWQLNRISVAQEHFCTAATQQIMTVLYTRMFASEQQGRRAVAMCVGAELHEIGLRILTDLLELDGWQTWYLGASVPPPAAAQLCVDQRADVLLVSATLPPHIESTAEVVRVVRARPELAEMKVIVGGRAFRNAPSLWRTIGADGYAADADHGVALARELTA